MIYTEKIKNAISFAIKTHEVDQKQKRKGKNVAYITHPLTVGLILACANANEDIIVAGILHDTVEDSVADKKVTKAIIGEKFGENVANLVMSVTEINKGLSWEERKRDALEHIEAFSKDSLLVKSADIISNISEIIDDYEEIGENVWIRFNAPKEKILENASRLISAILLRWPESPLAESLQKLKNHNLIKSQNKII